jgi:hypothetical protein
MTMTSNELLERLRRHYIKPGPFPGGTFIHEVGANGSHTSRRCDAIYVGFTASSGKTLVGHELKVSRADWLHELDQPYKAEAWANQCHAWYVVAPDITIVRPEDLPHGWGLLVVNPRSKVRMDVVVKAQVDEDRIPAWWAVRSVLARLDTLREADILQRVNKSIDARAAEEKQHARRDYEGERFEKLDQAVRASGLSADMLIELVPVLREYQDVSLAVRDARQECHGIVNRVTAALAPFSRTWGPLAKEIEKMAREAPTKEEHHE